MVVGWVGLGAAVTGAEGWVVMVIVVGWVVAMTVVGLTHSLQDEGEGGGRGRTDVVSGLRSGFGPGEVRGVSAASGTEVIHWGGGVGGGGIRLGRSVALV